MNGTTYQIGHLAAHTGLTPDALRYYERLRLLTPIGRTTGGFRLYGSETVQRVRFIQQAKSLGLTLVEIRELVEFNGGDDLKRCERVRDLLSAKVEDLESKLAEFRALRGTLKASLQQCEATIQRQSAADCPLREASRVT